MPEGDEDLRYGAEQVITHALIGVQGAYVPSSITDEYRDNHKHPALLPEVADDPERARAHADLVAGLARRASVITPQLDRLGVHPDLTRSIDNLKVAVDEGLVPQWAVAEEWGLWQPPTTYALEHVWTQWANPEEWQQLADFIDSAAAVAPPDSPFMSNLASTVLTNIDRLRRGDLEPGWSPPAFPDLDEPDDLDYFVEFELDYVPTEEDIAEQRRYEEALDRIQERLRQFVR